MSDYARVMETVERQILKKFDVRDEEMFDLRVDIGLEYLRKRYGDGYREQARSKSFWAFFRQAWHINDRKFLSMYKGMNTGWEDYIYFQQVKMNKFTMNSKLATTT